MSIKKRLPWVSWMRQTASNSAQALAQCYPPTAEEVITVTTEPPTTEAPTEVPTTEPAPTEPPTESPTP
ncbi:MAG: hypothetical protein HND47_22535 [Chloroflexi bacterium]|nr:hypothetical protein [Chloroflexota bacterium]